MSCDSFCPTVRVFDPPVTVVNDVFHPQIVEVVHQINVVNRHFCVPCEKHLYEYNYSDVDASQDSCHKSRRSRGSRSSRGSRGNSYISKAKTAKKSVKKAKRQ
ncbi:hypothetical protein [Paenibacillus sp. FSL H8-0537]|uniref:hypothetical protein n=1 Tax=Paenibacillus sp. FSL H8-0537 TaxID=2921399 RepID=UPI003100B10B